MRATVLQRVVLQVGIALCLVSTTVMSSALAQQGNRSRSEFPGRRVGGGTRGECVASSQSLVALNPVNNLGVTASDRPTVYVSMQPSDETFPVEFSLRDTDGQTVYETSFETTKHKSFVGVQLPEKVLKAGQDYQWYFSAICDPDDRSQNVVLSGWLRRETSQTAMNADASLSSRLAQVKTYQAAGLWNDAIAAMVELRQTYPRDNTVLLQWKQLLQALDLDTVVEQSLASHL